MKMSEAFPSKFLRAADLPEGASIPVVIDKVTLEEVGEDRETKPVAYFKGKQKGLVLNKTNAGVIADAYGDESDGWTNKPINLVVSKVLFQGKFTPCVRVELPKKLRTQAPAPVTEAAPPFVAEGVDLANCPF
jgi:hypothetical protein